MDFALSLSETVISIPEDSIKIMQRKLLKKELVYEIYYKVII